MTKPLAPIKKIQQLKFNTFKMLGPQGQFLNNSTDVPIIELLALVSHICDTQQLVHVSGISD